ncbi:MAG: ATP-dependent Clp protease ATP-binding subunit [Candidatus Magasanikbacteria bacterium]|nr:ATP-dependent Clp protease ATP-binding subunit [Candidatus Magasanikbacteria bacterium]
MQFNQPLTLPVLTCEPCKTTGFVGYGKCKACHGMAAGMSKRGSWLYWNYPLTRYHLALQAGRRILHRVQFITALVLWLNAWIWFGFSTYKQGTYTLIFSRQWREFFLGRTNSSILLFWLGVVALLYVWYRLIRQKELTGAVEPFVYNFKQKKKEEIDLHIESWTETTKIIRKKKRNIAKAFTEEALSSLAKAYKLASKARAKELRLEHLFYALLSFNRIGNIFIRLGIPASSLQKELEPMLKTDQKQTAYAGTAPAVSKDVYQIIFQAYEEAYKSRQNYVSVTELLIAVIEQNQALQEILFNFNISERQLVNAVEWARMRERLHREYIKSRQAASHHSKYGMDKAMTALATPYLNSFSSDITMLAHYGQLDQCVARTNEIDEIFQVVESDQYNVLLVGDHGVGKSAIVEGVAQNMIRDEVPDRLKDKRLVRLSISALLAGTSPEGMVERLRHIMEEISRARNVVLFINNLHELIGVSIGNSGSLDIADTLAEFLSNRRFFTIATTTPDDYAKYVTGSTVKDVFTKVDISKMDEDQAIQVLESRAGVLEYKHNVFFSYAAIEKCVEFANKFLHETNLPGSALEIMNEAAVYTRNKKGTNTIVTGEEVAAVVTEKTKIPLSVISSSEADKLMHLEEEMHKRVVGQDEGVSAVANALRRARAEIRSSKRPIASFLFLGPTGVGKTELAKTIAEVYFGGEDKSIRFDMSEYQDKSSIYRLIGLPGEKGTGVLTEAVRRNPFSLLLLDEIEKADPDVLNLFLQVMEDGRVSDSSGHAYDFTNVIIIATSNAGTAYVQEQNKNGVAHEQILNQLLHSELKQYFRPEFLNRFDGIILFNELGREDIKKIAGLMFARIAKDAEAKGISLAATDSGLEYLVDVGFDPEFGARPMRRALQEKVENKLAELFLQGALKRGITATFDRGGEITLE